VITILSFFMSMGASGLIQYETYIKLM